MAWLARTASGGRIGASRCAFPRGSPASWRNEALRRRNGAKVRQVRRVWSPGAIEIERAGKRIGSSLEADPFVCVSDPDLFAALLDVDLAEVSITSAATLVGRRGNPRQRFASMTCQALRSR